MLGNSLSNREFEVLGLIAEGCSNKQIGQKLKISARTVQTHVSNIFDKLGAKDRANAVAIAFRRGFFH